MGKRKIFYLLGILLLVFIIGCTPQKVVQEIPEEKIEHIQTPQTQEVEVKEITKTQEKPQQETESLENAAKKYLLYVEEGRLLEIYEFLTTKRKAALHNNQAEFARRYLTFYDEIPIYRLLYRDSVVDGDVGIVTYRVVYPRLNMPFIEDDVWVAYFRLEDGKWKFDGYSREIYGFCNIADDCSGATLGEACSETCGESGYVHDGYTCEDNKCKCRCYTKKDHIKKQNEFPNWNLIH